MSQSRAFLLVLGVWAVIYLPGLGTLEIKGEEGRRILPAVTMLQTGNFLVPHVGSDPYFTKPPLINWLVALSFKLTGTHNEWSARLPSALCVLAVGLAFVTVARRALGANGSLIGALIWLTNFGMLEKGRLIELEALYVSLTGLAFICWLSWWQERRSPWVTWIVPWIFLGLGLLAKGPLHLVFFYAVVFAVLAREGELRRLWNPAHFVGLLLMLGMFAAWAVPCLQMMQASDVTQTWARQFSGRVSGEDFKFSGWILNVPRGVGYFLPWTLLLVFVRRSTLDREAGLAWGVALSLAGVSLLPGALPRYTMPLLVPACWLMASLLSTQRLELPGWLRPRSPSSWPGPLRLPGIVAALAVAAMFTYAFALMPVLLKREKVRSIAACLHAALPAGSTLFALDPDYQPFLFYLRNPVVYAARLSEIPATARFLLVQSRDETEAIASQQWSPRSVRRVVQITDYRGKVVALLEIGPEK